MYAICECVDGEGEGIKGGGEGTIEVGCSS